jgi:hypothetical protein
MVKEEVLHGARVLNMCSCLCENVAEPVPCLARYITTLRPHCHFL